MAQGRRSDQRPCWQEGHMSRRVLKARLVAGNVRFSRKVNLRSIRPLALRQLRPRMRQIRSSRAVGPNCRSDVPYYSADAGLDHRVLGDAGWYDISSRSRRGVRSRRQPHPVLASRTPHASLLGSLSGSVSAPATSMNSIHQSSLSSFVYGGEGLWTLEPLGPP